MDNDFPIPPSDPPSSSYLNSDHSSGSLPLVNSQTSPSTRQGISSIDQEELYQRVWLMNSEGVKLILSQKYGQACEQLEQCERILEYAANCGQTIDCNLILTVLHNQATAYQRCGRSDKASSYVEAVIYNLEGIVETPENVYLLENMRQAIEAKDGVFREGQKEVFGRSGEFKDEIFRENVDAIKAVLKRKLQLGIYYLQFSGLNSQNQLHNQSLSNAQKALSVLKQLCQLSLIFHSLDQSLAESKDRACVSLLRELSETRQQFDFRQLPILRFQFKKWSSMGIDNNHPLQEAYRSLSSIETQQIQNTDIHGLFDLVPTEAPPQSGTMSVEVFPFSYFAVIKQTLYIMGAYFAIAVQLEQIDNSEHRLSIQGQQFSRIRNGPNRINAQMNILNGLILGYHCIPEPTELTLYLKQLYSQTYMEETSSETPSTPIKAFQQQHLLEVAEEKEEIMQLNINILADKYKNYMVEKDLNVDLVTSQLMPQSIISVSSPEGPRHEIIQEQSNNQSICWEKQSKKLKELFSSGSKGKGMTSPPTLNPTYISQMAETDSISMANSNSVVNPSFAQISSDIPKLELKRRKNKVKFNKNLKSTGQIPQCQSDSQESMAMTSPNFQNAKLITFKKSKKQKKKSSNKSRQKSKSMKNIQPLSKDKLIRPLKVAVTQGRLPSDHKIKSRQKSSSKMKKQKKSLSKSPGKLITGSLGMQPVRMLASYKKTMVQSDNIKPAKGFAETASSSKDHNMASIKFNKVKAPRVGQPLQPHINESGRNEVRAAFVNRTSKSKSKSKNLSSGSKDSSQKKCLNRQKSANKTLKSLKSQLYTQSSTHIKKR